MDPQALMPLQHARSMHGWLDRDRTPVVVRTDLAPLGTALKRRSLAPLADARPQLARLPSAELRTLLRKTSAELRRAVEAQPCRRS
jgi:hypothetical protein